MDIAEKLELLEKSKKTLDSLTIELRKRGYAKAMAEREYRMALAKKEIELRGRGNNYPANLVYDIARGEPEIAELRYKKQVLEIEVDVCRDRLRNERSSIEALRSLIAFDRVNYQNS